MKTRWIPGNRITLLENGEAFYPRVFEAIGAAKQEVLLETFIIFDDQVGRELQQALLRAADRGATVHILVDGWGSADLPPGYTRRLLEGGVNVHSFEPAQRLFGARTNLLRRMHRKLVVVDGRHAFVGGINYGVDHLVTHDPLAKQDYAVEVEGPLVEQIRDFCRSNLATPEPPRLSLLQRWRARVREASARPTYSGQGGALAAFVTRDNRRHRSDIERHYRIALRAARERVLIANAYFFPGYRLLRDLRRAARRGVQVDLILQGRPDLVWAQWAASLLYRYLLGGGVRIHEYCERPLHAKVAVVDDIWATVGSSNLDPTSLGLNLEANVVVRDEAFARQVRARLEHLLQQRCRLVQLPAPGPLRSAWIAISSTIVFHFLRRFPAWTRQLPVHAPKVAPLQSDAT